MNDAIPNALPASVATMAPVGAGSFHKTLPHDPSGDVNPAAFADFSRIATSLNDDYETVARGPIGAAGHAPFKPGVTPPSQASPLVNPQGGLRDG